MITSATAAPVGRSAACQLSNGSQWRLEAASYVGETLVLPNRVFITVSLISSVGLVARVVRSPDI